MDENILRKIKKCLALSQSSEPAEAAAALRQAQKLMTLHNVDALDLKRSDIGTAEVRSKASVSRIKDWELSLLNTVAKAFGCSLMWRDSSSYSQNVFGCYTLVGLKSQVQLAQYTADVMQRKLMKARAEFLKTVPHYYYRQEKTAAGDGFCHGWVMAVKKTVHEFAMPDETKRLIKEHLDTETEGRDAKKPQERQCDADGLRAGYEAGQAESIHRPLNESHLKLTKSP